MAVIKRPYQERERHGFETEGPSRTKQDQKEDCDINLIVRRHAQTGFVNHVTRRVPTYGDVSEMVSLQDALEEVRAAQDEFEGLPAAVRAAALNDPVRFLELLASEEGVEVLRDAGLEFREPDQVEVPVLSPQADVPPAGDSAPTLTEGEG